MSVTAAQLQSDLSSYIADRVTADALNASLQSQLAASVATATSNAAALASANAQNTALTARLAAASAGRIVYVSTTGSDANAGTQTAPVQTIAKAVSLGGVSGHLDIAAGTYKETPAPLAGQTWFGYGAVIDFGGKAYGLTGPAGVCLFGISCINAVFNAAQQYAIVTNENWLMVDVSANSDSGGIRVVGSGVNLKRCTGSGCGQNGISGGNATNCVLDTCTAHNNNSKNFSSNVEGGGGKFSKCSNITFINCDFSGNTGVGLWFDVTCSSITINGGRYSLNMVGGANIVNGVPNQVSNIRFELSTGLSIQNVTSVCAPGQNTAFQVCDGNTVSMVNNSVTGQIGTSKTVRAGAPAVNNITVTGNNITGSIWDSTVPDVATLAANKIVYDSNTYHPNAKGYFWGKEFDGLAGLQSIGLEKNGKVAA